MMIVKGGTLSSANNDNNKRIGIPMRQLSNEVSISCLLLVLSFLLSNVVDGQQIWPMNDLCEDAIVLTVGTPSEKGTTIDASQDYVPICSTSDSTAAIARGGDFLNAPGSGIWYKVVGTGGLLQVSTCGSPLNAQVKVFTGPSCYELQCIEASSFMPVITDDSDESNSIKQCTSFNCLMWLTEANADYYMLVQGLLRDDFDDFIIVVNDVPDDEATSRTCAIVPPVNDGCSGAISLPPGGDYQLSTTTSATADADTSRCGTTVPGLLSPGVWYTIVGGDEFIIAHTCNSRTNFDTQISVFTSDDNNNDCSSIVCLDGNDNACGSDNTGYIQSAVRWYGEENVTYYILLNGWGMYRGDFYLSVAPTNASIDDIIRAAGSEPTPPDESPEWPLDSGAVANGGGGFAVNFFTNDFCANATQISIGTTKRNDDNEEEKGTNQTTTNNDDGAHSYNEQHVLVSKAIGSTVWATMNDDVTVIPEEGKCGTSNYIDSPGIWYSVLGTGNPLVATTCIERQSPGLLSFDTQISVYTTNDIVNCSGLICVSGNDNSGEEGEADPSFETTVYTPPICGVQSTVVWYSTEATMYFILVHGKNGKSGNFEISIMDLIADESATQTTSQQDDKQNSHKFGSSPGEIVAIIFIVLIGITFIALLILLIKCLLKYKKKRDDENSDGAMVIKDFSETKNYENQNIIEDEAKVAEASEKTLKRKDSIRVTSADSERMLSDQSNRSTRSQQSKRKEDSIRVTSAADGGAMSSDQSNRSIKSQQSKSKSKKKNMDGSKKKLQSNDSNEDGDA